MTSKSLLNVLFIDTNVQGYQNLANNVTPDTEVVLIGSGEDGIDAITTALAGRSNLDSIQILSHGSSGNLQIGASWLNAASLQDYSAKIRSWGNALGETGDILFLGCNFAEDEAGIDLIQQISQLTGADVAASVDLTGSSALGGDWDLEAKIGDVDTSIGIQSSALANYDGTLVIGQGLISDNLAVLENINFDSPSANPYKSTRSGVLITEGLDQKNYNFQVTVDDDLKFTIDGTTLINDTDRSGPTTKTSADFSVSKNAYPIELQYENVTGAASLDFKWKADKDSSYIDIDPRRLFPGALADVPTVSITPIQSSVSEKSGKVEFKINVDKIPSFPTPSYNPFDFDLKRTSKGIHVYYKVESLNALTGSGLAVPSPRTGEVDVTQDGQILSIPFTNDDKYELDEQIKVTLDYGAYLRGSNQSATVNIIDDERPQLQISKIADKTEGEPARQKEIFGITVLDSQGSASTIPVHALSFPSSLPNAAATLANNLNIYLDITGIAELGTFTSPAKSADYKLFYTAYSDATKTKEKEKKVITAFPAPLAGNPNRYEITVPSGTGYISLQVEDINDEVVEIVEKITVTLVDNQSVNNGPIYTVVANKNTTTADLGDNEPTVSLGKVVNITEDGGFESTIVSLADAISLDGSNSYVEVKANPSLNLATTGQFTQEVWISPNFTQDGTYGIIGYQTGENNGYPSISLVKTGDKTEFQIGFGNGTKWNNKLVPAQNINNFNLNGWNHIATTFDGTDYKLYINAVEVFSTDEFKNEKIASSQQLEIGKTGSNYFKGAIDEVRIWNIARSAGEIQSLMIDQLQGDEDGLIGYWDFNKDFDDKSVNNNVGSYQPTSSTAAFINNPAPQIGYVEVNLDKPFQGPQGLWVKYDITGGNAIQGTDYFNSRYRKVSTDLTTERNGIIIPQGQTSGRIYFSAIADRTVEGNEEIKIKLVPHNFDEENKAKHSLVFDGTDDYATANIKGLNTGNTAHTIEAWVYLEKLPTNRNWLLLLGDAATGSEHWVINANGQMQNGVWAGTQLNPTLEVGKWTHLAISFDGTNLTQYVNGQQFGASIPASFNLPNTNLKIGQAIDGNYFQGQISDVRVWNTARTATQIQTNKDAILNGTEAGLVAYYKTQQTSGTLLVDSSSQKSDGSLFNGTAYAVPSSNYGISTVSNSATMTIGDSKSYPAGIIVLDNNNQAIFDKNPLVIRKKPTTSQPTTGETSFKVKLSSQPTADVTVTFGTDQGSLNSTTRTFSSSNWDTLQTVELTRVTADGVITATANGYFSGDKKFNFTTNPNLRVTEGSKTDAIPVTPVVSIVTQGNVKEDSGLTGNVVVNLSAPASKGGIDVNYTMTGTATAATDYQGIGNYALKFDGQDDYVSTTVTGLKPGKTAHTIEAWVYLEKLPTSRNWLFMLGTPGTGSEHWVINANGEMQNGAWGDNHFRPILEVGKWTHLATSFDGTNLTQYVNGQKFGASRSSSFNLTNTDLTLGKAIDGNYFQGQIRDVRVWDVARSAADIQANKDVILNGDETGLITYYQGNPTTDLSVTDSSSNHSHGKLQNGTTYTQLNTGTLTIPEGETQGVISVLPIGDRLSEDPETVTVTLNDGAGYTKNTKLELASATVGIVDDDKPGIEVVNAQNNPVNGVDVFSYSGNLVELVTNEPYPNVNNILELKDDKGLVVGTITLTQADITAGKVSITPTGTLPLASTSLQANLKENSSISATGLAINNAQIKINNGKVEIALPSTSNQASFGIRLQTKPTADVTLTFEGIDATEGILSKKTVTFTPGNWDVYQSVTVSGVDDTEIDGDIAYKLKATVTTTDTNYADKTLPIIAIGVKNLDDDDKIRDLSGTLKTTIANVPSVVIGKPATINEDQNIAQVQVKLSTPATENIDVTFDIKDGTATLNQDYQLSQGYLINQFKGGDTTKKRFDSPFNLVDVGDNSTVTFIDLDNDGDLDAVLGSNNGIKYYQNNGTKSNAIFEEKTTDNPFPNLNPQRTIRGFSVIDRKAISPTFGDINGDKLLDLIVGKLDGTLMCYVNTGTASNPRFQLPTELNPIRTNPVNGIDVGDNAAPILVDWNKDGKLDLVIGSNSGIQYYQNTGTLTGAVFTQKTGNDNPFNSISPVNDNPFNSINTGISINPNTGNFSSPSLVDWDRDGDLDLFVGKADGTISYYQNNSNTLSINTTNNPFQKIDNISNRSGNAVASFADLDGDGDRDAFVGNSSGTIDYYEQLNIVTFAKGEQTKTIDVVVKEDRISEGSENIELRLTPNTLSGKTTYKLDPPTDYIQFDGKDDYVSTTVTGLQPGKTAHTIEAWVYLEKLPTSRNWLLLLGNAGTGSEHWVINANGQMQNGAWADTQFNPTLEVGKWTHLATSYDGTNLTQYVNGQQFGGSTPAKINLPNTDLTIGKAIDGSYFQGQIRDVRVWNTARSATEIQANKDTLLKGTEPGLIAYYQPQITQDNVLVDSSTYKNNATLNNGATTNSQNDLISKLDINDNDIAGVTITKISGDKTSEIGGIVSYSVKLNTQPIAPVKVYFGTQDETEGLFKITKTTFESVAGSDVKTETTKTTFESVASLEFTPENWNREQTLSVQGVDDRVDDGDIAYKIITTPNSEDLAYHKLAVDSISLVNTDNDEVGFTVTGAGKAIEGRENIYSIRLNSQPVGDVRISMTPTNDQIRLNNEFIGQPLTLTFTPDNWNLDQTVRATALDDAVVEYLHFSEIKFKVETGESLKFESKADNNTAANAIDLGEIKGGYTWSNLEIKDTIKDTIDLEITDPSDIDWFKFTIPDTKNIQDFAQISFDQSQGDLSLELYSAADLTKPISTAQTSTNIEKISTAQTSTKIKKISLDDKPFGSYYLKVSGSPNKYELLVDNADNNFTQKVLPPLPVIIDIDWFKFTIPDTGNIQDFAQISFDQSKGDLLLELYSAADLKSPIFTSKTINNIAKISLNGQPFGSYYLKVSGIPNKYELLVGDADYNFTQKVLPSLPVIIEDNDLPTARIIAGSTASELFGEPSYFTVQLNAPASTKDNGIKVNYRVVGGTATYDEDTNSNGILDSGEDKNGNNKLDIGDYRLQKEGSVRIAPGDIQNNLIVVPIDDKLVEDTTALKFDGKDDYLSTSIKGLDKGNTKHTIEAWVYLEKLPTERNWLLLLGDAATGSEHWVINANGQMQNGVWAGTQLQPTLKVGEWTHLAMSYDGTNLTQYVNGQQFGASTPASFNLPNTNLTIGKAIDGSYFQGQLRDVRVWNTARTAAEIQTNQNQVLSGTESGLVTYYRDAVTDTTKLTDLSGKGNHAILNGGVQLEKTASENVVVELLPGDGYQLSENPQATLDIQDDDVPGVRIVQVGDNTTVREGDTATFQVSLLSESKQAVTITLTPGAEVEFVKPNGEFVDVKKDVYSFKETPELIANNIDVKLNSFAITEEGNTVSFDVKVHSQPSCLHVSFDDGFDSTLTPTTASKELMFGATEGNWDRVEQVTLSNLDRDANGNYKITATIGDKTVEIPIERTTEIIKKQQTWITIQPEDWFKLQTIEIKGSDDSVAEPGLYHQGTINYTVTSGDSSYNGIFVPPQRIDVQDRLLDAAETAQTIQEGFTALQQSLDSLTVPLIGSLKGKVPSLISDITDKLIVAIGAASQLTAGQLNDLIEKTLNSLGLDFIDVTVETTDDDLSILLSVGKEYNLFSLPLDANLGLDALGISLKTEGAIKSTFDFNVALGFGLHKDFGFYIDTAKTQVDAGIKLNLKDFKAQGNLGFLRLDIKDDVNNPNKNDDNPTELAITFKAGINDLDNYQNVQFLDVNGNGLLDVSEAFDYRIKQDTDKNGKADADTKIQSITEPLTNIGKNGIAPDFPKVSDSSETAKRVNWNNYLTSNNTFSEDGYIENEGIYRAKKDGNGFYLDLDRDGKQDKGIETKLFSIDSTNAKAVAKWVKDGKVKEFRIEKKKEVDGKIQYYFDKNGDNNFDNNIDPDEKITEKQKLKYDANKNLKLDADVTVEGEGTFVQGAGIAFVDKDGNGKLDIAEYGSVINSNFGDLTIADEAITSIEFWDLNNNNLLDVTDFHVLTEEDDEDLRFIDLNRNGKLDENEPQSDSEEEPFLIGADYVKTTTDAIKYVDLNGNNTFDSTTEFNILTDANKISFLDLNRDGKFDLLDEPYYCEHEDGSVVVDPLAVNITSGTEAFIDFNGDGQFTASSDKKIITNPDGSRFLDLNGNSIQDPTEARSKSEDDPLTLGKINLKTSTTTIAGNQYNVVIKDRVQFVDLDGNGELTVDSDDNPLEPTANPNNKFDLSKVAEADLAKIVKFRDDGDRLTLTELRNWKNDPDLGVSDLFNYEFAGNANLGLQAKTSIEGDPALPSVSFELAVGLPLFNYGNQDAAGDSDFSVEFNGITLDAGTFLTKFATPVINTVDQVIAPIKPVIEMFNADTKIFSALGIEDQFNKDGRPGVSIIDIGMAVAELIPADTKDKNLLLIKSSIPKAIKFIKTIEDILATVDSLKALTANEGSLSLDLGSYSLDDLKAASDDPADTTSKVKADKQGTKTSAATTPEAQANTTKSAKQSSALSKLKALDGLKIPLLTDPTTIIRILLGEPDVDLLKYDIPDLDFLFSQTRQVPLMSLPDIRGLIDLEFTAKTDLSVGYDTHGLEAWRDSDFALEDIYKVLDGFYLDDWDANGKDKDEFRADARIVAGVSASLVVVKAVLKAGINGYLGFDLVDVGELQGKSDGKIRGSEIISRISTPLELFNLKGQLDAFASAEVKVGVELGLFEIMKTIWSVDVGPITLAKFNVGASGITFSSAVSNSYINSATVFFDANLNNQWDAGDENTPAEPITFTNEYGQYNLDIGLEWDRNQDGIINEIDGQIISVGGFDTSSGTAADKFISLPGATIVTPLTSLQVPLVQSGLTSEQAETLIKAQLGLDPNFALQSFDSLTAVGQDNKLGLEIYLAHIQVQALVNHGKALLDGLEGDQVDRNNSQWVQAAFAKFLHDRSLTTSTAFDLSDRDAIASFYTFLLQQHKVTATPEQVQTIAGFLSESNQLLDKVAAVGASKSLKEALPALASVKRVVQSEIPNIITEFLTNPTEKTLAKFNDALYQNYTLVSDDINSFGNRSIKITSSKGKLIENSPDLVQFTIELSDPAPNQGLTVLYSISGTGTLGQDYNLNTANKTGEIYIAPGTTTGIIEVSLLNDELVENIETISINLTAAGEGYLIDPTASAGVLLILDDEKNNSIVSTTGNSVKGTFGNDSLVGSEGKDRLLGLYGNDTVDGQAGDDFIQGGHGKDSIIGGAGSDRLEGNFGDDIIEGNAGSDYIDGGTGNDQLTGGSDFDFIFGGVGNDHLAGNSGNDQLEGGVGNDYLDGNEDNDWLNGDDGDDILIGNRGDDLISGGQGKDAFFFASADHGFDTILDFNPDDGDRIQISRSGFGVDNLDGFRFVSGILDFNGQNLALLQNNGQTYSYFPNLADIIEIVDEPTISTHSVKAPPELFATSLPPFLSIPETDDRTILDDIVNRGYLKLISNSSGDSIDLVFARTLAIALFGDDSKIEFITTETYAESFELLGKRAADLSIDRITHTLARDSEFNIDFSPLYLYDAQSFVVSHQSKIENMLQLDGKTIGLIEDSTTYANITNVFNSQGIKFTPKFYADLDELMAGYLAGEVDAASTDKTLLSESLKDISKLAEHSFIDVDLSKEPIGIAIPDNDSTWADFVRWVNYIPAQAEELGINSQNVGRIFSENLDNSQHNDASIAIRRFLGIEDNIYQAFAKFNVQPDFVVKIIQAVGNYAEIHQKYFPGEERNRNELWSNGGLIYSPPFAGTAAEIKFIDNNNRNVLTNVLERGKLIVGTSDTNFGFSVPDSNGKLVGFDIDLSTALAAAIFGDAKAVEFVLEDGLERFTNVANGIVDISAAQATHNLVRDTQYGVDFTPTYIYTGQGVVARKASGIFNLSTLNGRKIGAVANTTSIQNLQDALVKYAANADFIEFVDEIEMFAAYQRGEVDAVTSDIPLLSSAIANFADAQDHELLNVTISQEPLAMVIDENQSEWGDVVRWLQYALLQAEELGITQANIDRLIVENTDKDPTNNAPDNVRILLGLEGNIGKKLGIPNDFVVNAIKAVGNYGEIYERHFKDLPRDFNQLSTNFGLQIPYPLGISPDPTPVNIAPTAILLVNTITQLSENIDTTGGIKVADIAITDDALGKNQLSLSGNDASSFEIRGNNLFFVGSNLDFETKVSYNVTINVDDPTTGNSPDLNQNFTLNLTNIPDLDVSAAVISFIDQEGDGLGKLSYDLREVGNAILTASDTALAQTDAAFHNIIGLYQVLDEQGTIQANTDINGDGKINALDVLNPGDADYVRTAIANVLNHPVLQLGSEGDPIKNTNGSAFENVLLEGGAIYAPLIVANGGSLIPTNGTIKQGLDLFLAQNPNNIAATRDNFMTHTVAYFSFANANPDGVAHLKNFGDNTFGFEDLPGNLGISDFDFNDSVFKFSLSNPLKPNSDNIAGIYQNSPDNF